MLLASLFLAGNSAPCAHAGNQKSQPSPRAASASPSPNPQGTPADFSVPEPEVLLLVGGGLLLLSLVRRKKKGG